MIDIRIDTSGLTYTQFMIPELSSALIEGANVPTIHLEPSEYSFNQMSLVAFRFGITPNGLIDYDVANDRFLDGRGTTTLTVRGFPITLDGTLLSQDLHPDVFGAKILLRSSTHDLTLVPAAGYRFQSRALIDFQFDVTVDGQVSVDARYAGFAAASGQTLTISGYRITIDGRALSHDLLLLNLLGNAGFMPRDRTHEFTLMPLVVAYVLIAPDVPGIEFRFKLSPDGEIAILNVPRICRQ